MIISRGRSVLKLCSRTQSLLSNSQIKNCVPKKWHGSYTYRSARDINLTTKADLRAVEFVSAFFWWWMLWHFFTEYETLIGGSAPDPSEWTDEELGIPPL